MGLLHPDAGEVELFGESGPTLAARRRLGYLPERPYFYPHLKGRELLEYFGRLRFEESPRSSFDFGLETAAPGVDEFRTDAVVVGLETFSVSRTAPGVPNAEMGEQPDQYEADSPDADDCGPHAGVDDVCGDGYDESDQGDL